MPDRIMRVAIESAIELADRYLGALEFEGYGVDDEDLKCLLPIIAAADKMEPPIEVLPRVRAAAA